MRPEQPNKCLVPLQKPRVKLCTFQYGSSVVVLCCLFFVSVFQGSFTLHVFILFYVGFGCCVVTVREIAAHSVDHMYVFVF